MTPDDNAPHPDEVLTPVWRTTEAMAVPHVLAALEQAGIEYMVQDRGIATELIGQRSTMTVGETAPPLSVLVRSADEGRAREIITTLLSPMMSGPVAAAAEASPVPVSSSMPVSSVTSTNGDVEVVDVRSGRAIGTLTEAQLQELSAHLERESETDDDYYIDGATLEMLEGQGVSQATTRLLRRALGTAAGIDIRWVRRG